MKKLLFALALVALGHKGWQHFQQPSLQPLQDGPYLVVYGRDSCGFTQQLLSQLRQSGVHFQYASVDDPEIADSLHARMNQAGISTRRYNLPVVDLNNQLSIRPKPAELIGQARDLAL